MTFRTSTRFSQATTFPPECRLPLTARSNREIPSPFSAAVRSDYFAQQASLLDGASTVFAIDRSSARLELAKRVGSTPISATNGDAVAQIRELTKGRGVDVAIEAVGLPQTITDALNVIRPFGMVSIVGVSEAETMTLPIKSAYLNGTRLAMGTCSVQNYIQGALNLMAQGRINAAPLADTKIPLESVAQGYERFDTDKSVFKVLMTP